jgi:hypothetical protein
MLRFLTIGSMTGGFLIISPGLRGNVIKVYGSLVLTMNDWSPWSYIAIGLVFFVLLTIELYRHAFPKGMRIPKY